MDKTLPFFLLKLLQRIGTGLIRNVLISLCLAAIATPVYCLEQEFIVLNYHDIVGAESAKPPYNRLDVSVDHFEEQLQWLKKNKYKIISVQTLFDAAAGKINLPAKAVLLTFDDGYESFYTRIFPILKKQQIPATVGLVGTWMEGKETPDEPGKTLMTWAQVNELAHSGLVEIASHSYDLHKDIIANPQGNTQAAAVTRFYDDPMLMYESDDQYRERIQKSLFNSADFIFQHTGLRPRVIIWPYGEYNETTLTAAHTAGMPMTMGLVDGKNTLANFSALRRMILFDNPELKAFSEIVTKLRSDRELRVAHLDMDYLYDNDPEQTNRNIDLALQRIADMHINTVFLQAFADPDGDGNADALYFPNRHLPVKQDLFSRVAWQLKRKAAVRVYAWLPIMAYQKKLPESWYVQEWREGKVQSASHIYTRLSPFNADARQFVAEIYEDLAKHCNFDGILFHDDGILSDFEDVSPNALKVVNQAWGLPADPVALRATPAMRLAWAQHKTELINQFTDELTSRVHNYRPGVKTARNMYAMPILKPYAEEWYAQSFKSFLKHYDYVAIEAMPFMEGADKADQWLESLTSAVRKEPDGLKKTVFELQTIDWKNNQKITMPVFIGQLKLLKRLGALHLGYYPDNVYEDQPKLTDLQRYFSATPLP